MSSSKVIFDSKRQSDVVNLSFNFISKLAVGETITTKAVTATVWSGVDANPGNIINGAATSAGTVVTQSITGGVLGVIYLLKCSITTSAGQTLSLVGLLTVIPDGP